ncbi:homoserine O-acetyltransferase [Rossellomorea sp. BNER]|nr:homoserine O-acetyltransferase [Rossellomorea sp. BNER]
MNLKKSPLPHRVRETGKVFIGNLALESGEELEEVELAYERCGADGAPVILVCHALTGSQYAVGTDEEPGWWHGLIGTNKAVDLNSYQVVTFNVLGGCNGSTGPLSINPSTGEKYRTNFPKITIRDIVNAQHKALWNLGIDTLLAVIGGSLGGMQALEWGLLYPSFIEKIIVLAATSQLSDYGIAFNTIGTAAIENDPGWNGGYYKHPEEVKGLEVARIAGMVTYRSPYLFDQRFQRKEKENSTYEVESYLKYQGKKLTRRFDPNSYLYLLQAMNSHDIGRGRGGMEEAARSYKPEVIGIGFQHDLIYPPNKIKEFTELIPRGTYYYIPTQFGHDGFLVEFERWATILSSHLADHTRQKEAR